MSVKQRHKQYLLGTSNTQTDKSSHSLYGKAPQDCPINLICKRALTNPNSLTYLFIYLFVCFMFIHVKMLE